MTEYPQWLVDRVAKAMFNNASTHYTWEEASDWQQELSRSDAVAALDALNYRKMPRHPGYWAGPAIKEQITP